MNEDNKKDAPNKSLKEKASADKNDCHKHFLKIKFPVFFGVMKKYFSTNKKARRIILFLIAAVFIYSILLLNYSFSPVDKGSVNVMVNIPTGTSFRESTEILNKAGLIKNRFFFYSLAALKGARRNIRAGEYEFNTSYTPWTIIDKLVRGEIKIYKVTICEDLSLREIAEILDRDKLINKDIFFELSRDKEFLESLNIKADSIEGYLFPETYYLNRSMNTHRIMKKMVDTFWQKVTPGMIQKAGDIGLNENQFITLASMIGKESGDNFEKPFIAAVFYNRLKKGMRLQSDPTAVYDMDNFDGKVYRSHLRRDSPYNTYIIKGLPPGPIANPGLTSLKATLNPAPVDYLYFVSKRDGTHYFSSSLSEHNKAISRYIYQKNEKIQQLENSKPQFEAGPLQQESNIMQQLQGNILQQIEVIKTPQLEYKKPK
jgi:UPF0755 protein